MKVERNCNGTKGSARVGLPAKAMDYDSCPMIGYDSNQLAEINKLPADHVIGFIITVGKATKTGRLPMDKVLITATFK